MWQRGVAGGLTALQVVALPKSRHLGGCITLDASLMNTKENWVLRTDSSGTADTNPNGDGRRP
jgi:hypothetical protein